MASEKGLTPEGLCSILRACRESQVSELKFGPLHVKFGPPVDPEPVKPTPAPATATEIADTQKNIAKESLAQDEAKLRETQLALAFIENPMLAEQMLMDGELEPHGDDGADEEA